MGHVGDNSQQGTRHSSESQEKSPGRGGNLEVISTQNAYMTKETLKTRVQVTERVVVMGGVC